MQLKIQLPVSDHDMLFDKLSTLAKNYSLPIQSDRYSPYSFHRLTSTDFATIVVAFAGSTVLSAVINGLFGILREHLAQKGRERIAENTNSIHPKTIKISINDMHFEFDEQTSIDKIMEYANKIRTISTELGDHCNENKSG